MVRIRSATILDTPALVELGRLMHAESPRFRRFDFDGEKIAQLAVMLIQSPDGILLVAEVDGELVGMYAGFVSEHFFGHDRFATDYVAFVAPAHRGGTVFIRLLAEFERQAAARGAKEVFPGVSTEVRADRTATLYERRGYRLSGYIAVKDLGNV